MIKISQHLCDVATIVLLGSAGVVGLGSFELQSSDPLRLVPHSIALSNGKTFQLDLPEQFQVSVAAEGLKRARFMAKAPDGRIFVTSMYNPSDNSLGSVYILDAFDARSQQFQRVVPYLRHLRNPNGIAFYTDPAGQAWLYLALTDKLVRFRFRAGEESPSLPPEVLATYPDAGLSYQYGGWHVTRTIVFDEKENQGKLFISVGSSCNACEEKEEIRATISIMDADGKHQRIVARGLRNAVGLRSVSGVLYATNMGADHLGNDAPDDTMFAFDKKALSAPTPGYYGWPFCYSKNAESLADPKFFSLPGAVACDKVPRPFATFPAHSSPLGIAYFDSNSDDPALRDQFLVALHGSSRRDLGRGYKVVRLRAQEKPQDFLSGFLKDGTVYGRPCDIFPTSANSFLLSDDFSGVVYSVYKKPGAAGKSASAASDRR